MASIIFHQVDFAYPSAPTEVFQGLSLLIDTSWRTGLVGRNGHGKTTLLRLVAGELEPTAGAVENPVPVRLYPATCPVAGRSTFEVVRNSVAPFRAWEREMERLLEDGRAPALERYADVHERYLAAGGYEMEARIAREFEVMGLPGGLMARAFEELSGGEQTRASIVALFLETAAFPLIDEPTNHLDRSGRERLASYLAGKRGFLLVSHDRQFLDRAVDHVVSINASDVRVNQGNYSQWRAHMDEEIAAERRTRQRIERTVARLEVAARSTRRNAESREGDKYRTGAMDKGFIGHRAAKQMKRARNVERRIEAQLSEKRGLLRNAEKERHLSVRTTARRDERLVVVQNLALEAGGRVLFRNLSFTVSPCERLAVVGPNGCGKTTLLDTICGDKVPDAGFVRRPGHVTLSRGFQQPLWQKGALAEFLRHAGLDETRFRQLMGVLGVEGEIFERDLGTYSQGQLKKVDLCRSLLAGADVLIWDEPLNYVDLFSREQIEAAVLEDRPTLIFVEHDQAFIDRVATRVVDLTAL